MKILLLMLISLSLWANIGNIMAIKGSASVERSGERLDATNGMVLLKGDAIETAQKSRVQVMLKDETIVTIGVNSSFSFEEYDFDGTQKSSVSMRANRGFFRSVTGKIGKLAPERFKVKTASATIGIRGTDFSGDISGEQSEFRCYEGAIYVLFDGTINDVDAGMMLKIFKGKVNIKSFKNGSKFKNKVKAVAASTGYDKGISTENLSDITQVAEEAVDEKTIKDIDALDVEPGTEDRTYNY